MPFVYSLISRQKVILAEYTSSSGNFPTVTRVLLSKIPDQDGKMSYVYDNHVFHYISDQGIIFLCMSDKDTKSRIAFAYLEEIKKIWRERYASIEQTAIAFSLNDSFSPILRERMEHFMTNPNADNITRVQAQIDSVKDVMMENIDRVLERGEKIELLVDKTDRLNQTALKFEKSSRSVRNTMIYRKIRNYIIIFLIVVLVVFFITALACGITSKKCKSK